MLHEDFQNQANTLLIPLRQRRGHRQDKENRLMHYLSRDTHNQHKRHSPKIAKSPLATAAIRGVLSWCSGRLLWARRTDMSFDAGMRKMAWCTSRRSPPSIASSKKRWGVLDSISSAWQRSLRKSTEGKMVCKKVAQRCIARHASECTCLH